MTTVKAIETAWRGYRFRSRLEARWAVFFRYAGIKWEYEREGFETDLGRYLPDFYLPEIRGGLWLEIKPADGVADDEVVSGKIKLVAEGTGKHGMVIKGDPATAVLIDRLGYDLSRRPGAANGSAWVMMFPDGSADHPFAFCVCPWCGKIGVEFDGRGARVCVGHDPNARTIDNPNHYGNLDHPDKAYSANHPLLQDAAREARAARFEHGEVPA